MARNLFCLLVLPIVVSCVPIETPQPPVDMAQAWAAYRDALLKDTSLIRCYSFDQATDSASPIPNLAGDKGAPLRFEAPSKPGAPPAQLEVVEGPWPGKKAVRLDLGSLVAESFAVPSPAFTVMAWLRKNGPGSHRGNNDSTNGTLLSMGCGYWDGWRLTTTYPSQRIGFEIGRPKPSHSVGCATDPVGDGAWFHLAGVWDGREMRVYVDGLLAAAGEYAGTFTPPADGRFRVGYADAGMGSAILDVASVAIFSQALPPDQVLRSAYFQEPVSDQLVAQINEANRLFDGKEYAAAGAGYAAIADDQGSPTGFRRLARLRLGESLRLQRRLSDAAREYAAVFMTGGTDRGGRTALLRLLQVVQQGAGERLSAKVFEKMLGVKELTPQEKTLVRLHLARRLRRVGDLDGARGQYEEVLKAPETSARERLDIRLEMGHACWEEGDWAGARAEYAKVVAAGDAPPCYRSNAQLRIAGAYEREKDFPGAKAEYAKVAAMADAPAHHKREALTAVERLETGRPAREPAASRTVLPKLPEPGATLYVAPHGADSNAGTKDRPFATLERARDEIRALRQKGGLPSGGVAVLIGGGEYQVKGTLKLGAEDSGTEQAPILYRALGKEPPRFRGGVRVAGFKRVDDAGVLARLPEEARGKVWQADLKAQGITEYGKFEPGAYGSGRGFVTHPMIEVFFDGAAMPIARWPNDAFLTVGDLLGAQPFDHRGMPGVKDGKFAYDYDRPDRWKQEKDIWLYGYWFHDWADSYEKVAAVDTEKRVITLAPPYHRSGYRKGTRYYALNLLSEIDAPGEWYLDRDRGILYLYPPSDPNKGEVEVSMFEAPMLEMEGASHVTFRGLVWELGRGDGLRIKGGERCLLAGCTVRRFAGNGVVVDGGAGHGLLGCDIYTMGRGGTVIKGGDRKTLTPSGHFVENCHIYNLSRIDHTYTPAVLANGVGMRIAHNLMHDVRSSAMRVEGNDHLVDLNEVHSVVWESDDQGGVDVWGNPTYRGNVYRYNYFHHIGSGRKCGQAGIRLDDAISGTLLYGNVFYRCSDANFGAVQIHGGKDNIVDHNLFIDCKFGISFSGWGEKRWKEFLGEINKRLTEVAFDKPPYSERYPELTRLYENPDVNHVWCNVACNCGEFLTRDRGIQDLMDNYVTSAGQDLSDGKGERLRWKEISRLCEEAGFWPIPLGEIGLYRSDLRASWPVTHKVTEHYRPPEFGN